MSYADMITILMAFFVVMYSMAGQKDTAKEQAVMASLRMWLGGMAAPWPDMHVGGGLLQEGKGNGPQAGRSSIPANLRRPVTSGNVIYFSALEQNLTGEEKELIRQAARNTERQTSPDRDSRPPQPPAPAGRFALPRPGRPDLGQMPRNSRLPGFAGHRIGADSDGRCHGVGAGRGNRRSAIADPRFTCRFAAAGNFPGKPESVVSKLVEACAGTGFGRRHAPARGEPK